MLPPTTAPHQPSQTDMEQLEDQNQAEVLPSERTVQGDTLGRGEEMVHGAPGQQEDHAPGFLEHHAPGPRISGRVRKKPRKLEDYQLGGLHIEVQNPPPRRR